MMKKKKGKQGGPVVSTAFLSPHLALELSSGSLDDPLAILLDLFCSLDHPFVCKRVFICSNCAITNAF